MEICSAYYREFVRPYLDSPCSVDKKGTDEEKL